MGTLIGFVKNFKYWMALSVIQEYTPQNMKISNESKACVQYFHGKCSIMFLS